MIVMFVDGPSVPLQSLGIYFIYSISVSSVVPERRGDNIYVVYSSHRTECLNSLHSGSTKGILLNHFFSEHILIAHIFFSKPPL